MKIKRLSTSTILLLIAAIALPAVTGYAAELRRRLEPQPALQPIKVEQNMQTRGGTTLVIDRHDSPAFYKVTDKDEAGFSNGYCDNSFAIDWPTTVSKGDVNRLQDWLLSTIGDEEKPVNTVVDLVKQRNECSYSSAQRIPELPNVDDDECLRDRADVKLRLLNADIVKIEHSFFAYLGGGTGASFIVGTRYYYYDLNSARVLETYELFKPGVADVIVQALQQNDDEWDMLWDNFKDVPYAPENFCITDDKVVFIYSKYEIAPGVAGNIEAEVPISRLMAYATPLFRSIIADLNND